MRELILDCRGFKSHEDGEIYADSDAHYFFERALSEAGGKVIRVQITTIQHSDRWPKHECYDSEQDKYQDQPADPERRG